MIIAIAAALGFVLCLLIQSAIRAFGGPTDKERLNHLELLLKHCPHAEITWADPEEPDPLTDLSGFYIMVQGCRTSIAAGATLRAAIDEDIRCTKADSWPNEIMAVLVASLLLLPMTAAAEDVRDASGKLVTTSTKNGKTETVRSAGTGAIKETKQTTGNVTTVRDAAGRIIRTERK